LEGFYLWQNFYFIGLNFQSITLGHNSRRTNTSLMKANPLTLIKVWSEFIVRSFLIEYKIILKFCMLLLASSPYWIRLIYGHGMFRKKFMKYYILHIFFLFYPFLFKYFPPCPPQDIQNKCRFSAKWYAT